MFHYSVKDFPERPEARNTVEPLFDRVYGTQRRVNYHCRFGLPTGWRGTIARMILRRELEVGPEGSLLRVTRAAELQYSHADLN
jgi:hypothetical protein